MRQILHHALYLSLLTGPLLAQTAPGFSRGPTPSSLWNTSNPVIAAMGSGFLTASAQRLPSDPAGQWTVCLTMVGLKSAYGGIKYGGTVMGTWNPARATPFVPNLFASPLNSGWVEYSFHVEPGLGRYAIVERYQPPGFKHGGVYLATRANDRVAFGKPVRVNNTVALHTFGDPSIGYVGGKLQLFYNGSWFDSKGRWVRGTLMDEIIINNPNASAPYCAGKPVLVAAPNPRSGGTRWWVHSPTPVVGADGDVEGLWLAERPEPSTGVSNMYFADDLDPDTPHVLAMQSPTGGWVHNGAIAGGTFLAPETLAARVRMMEAEGAWLVGDVEPLADVIAGGTRSLDITMGAYFRGALGATAFVAWGTPLATPIRIPGMHGMLGINPLVFLGRKTVRPDQRATWSFNNLPNNPALKGTHAIQGWSVQLATNVATLTNTAKIVIK